MSLDLKAVIAAPSRSIAELNRHDPARAQDFLIEGPAGLRASFARQRYDRAQLQQLFAAVAPLNLPAALRWQMGGETVNITENRAALHTSLRGRPVRSAIADAANDVAMAARARMDVLYDGLAQSQVTDIVSIGIGGSDLGPRLVVDALRAPDSRFKVHFVSNVDGSAMHALLPTLDPARTAVILISKTFTTQETLLNGAIACEWLAAPDRTFAVTTNAEAAFAQFGIASDRILPMWDWVGGRYSLWSAVGFPILLAIGKRGFEDLLSGAAAMDDHALHAAAEKNLPLWHALTAVYNRAVLGIASHAVLPYDERLKLFPAYLQQLVMESLGKSAQLNGTPVNVDTVPVWWGGAGTDAQHSFFQALHQGTQIESMDLIGVIRPEHPYLGNHRALLSNLLAQSEAFANGKANEDLHRSYAGNRPNTVILLPALNAQTLGALIAMYEHSVYLQSVIWNINPFDQFGVELGKQLASGLLAALRGEGSVDDPVTATLLAQITARAADPAP